MGVEDVDAPEGANTLSMDVRVVDGMVPKVEFDRAIEAAQQALRAKTASSQQMLSQASSAMRNALTALSLSEQEVANLKATVKELQERPAEGTNEIIEREREELKQAQQRVADLSGAFRQLQSEVARVRYEQEGFDMPVAMSLPVKISPELSSRVTVIAQLVMLGYSYEDGEMALDAIKVNDLHLALEWLEGRHATKTQFSINGRRAVMMNEESQRRQLTYKTTTEVNVQERAKIHKPGEGDADRTSAPPPPRESTTTEQVREIARRGGTTQKRAARNQMNMYDARKRAVSSMICMAIRPPGAAQGFGREKSEEVAQRCIEALARLAHSRSSFMILSLGGNRCAFDCLKLYEANPRIVIACFKLLRALESNLSTMMHLKKQQRFRLLPNTVSRATGLHSDELDVIAEGAHTLWAANTLGGKIAQERVKNSGYLRFVKSALTDKDIEDKDPRGTYRKKILGMLLSMAHENKTMQQFLVDEGFRALLRRTLQEKPGLSFAGEFASLRDWLKDEYDAPSFAPDADKPQNPNRGARDKQDAQGMHKSSKTSANQREKKILETQKRASALRRHMQERGATREGIYFAKKRVVSMLCTISLNPPGSVVGVSKADSEEIAYRCLLALARISERNGAYLVLTCGGPRTTVDCMRYYLYNADIMYACMRILRALLCAPTTMIRLMKQVRFKILPSAIMDAVMRHSEDLEMKAEAAHALWSYTGVGGKPAQETVLDSSPYVLDFLKDGLAMARADVGSNQYIATIRKFIGCILSLAKDNKEIQDELVEVELRRDIRKALSENQGISFQGEFGSLRDWIRGDRGGARSISRSTTTNATTMRKERNAAEQALDTGTAEDSKQPTDHIEAQKLFKQESEDDVEMTPAPKAQTRTNPLYEETKEQEAPKSQRVQPTSDAEEKKEDNSRSSPEKEMPVKSFASPPEDDDPGALQKSMSKNARNQEDEDASSSKPAEADERDADKESESGTKEKTWTINEAIRVLNARDNISHQAASEALADMLAEEPTVGIAVILNGGLAAIAHAITMGEAPFCAGACALVHMLTAANLTLKRAQSDEAVIDGTLFCAIIDAMTRFPDSIALLQWAATAIWALIRDNHRGKSRFVYITSSITGESSLRVLKNALVKYGSESEGVARACIGCLCALAVNSIPTQKLISDLALPHVMLLTLGKHSSISFRGEFDSLREWLRDNAARKDEVDSSASGARRKYD